MICKECGAYNPDHATYCKVCAANLKEDVSEAAREEVAEDPGATRRFVRPSWTVPNSERTKDDDRPVRAAKHVEQPTVEDEPMPEDEEEAEADSSVEQIDVEPKEKETFRPIVPASIRRRREDEQDDEDDDEMDSEPMSDEEDDYASDEDEDDEDEDVYVPARKRPAPRSFAKHTAIRRERDYEDDEDADDDYEKDRYEDEYDDYADEDDSYEYEPTPPKKSGRRKGNGPLFWVLLAAIIVVILCLIGAGVLMVLQNQGKSLSCSGLTETSKTQPNGEQPKTSDNANAPSTGTDSAGGNQDMKAVTLEENVINDKGKECVKLSFFVPAHTTFTIVLPQNEQTNENTKDATVRFDLMIQKDFCYPNVPLTSPTYEVKPEVYLTAADGTVTQLDVPSFTLDFPTLSINLEKPVADDEGKIMADKNGNVAITGRVDDFDVQVYINDEPVTVYEGGLFMYDYKVASETAETVTIRAEKPNFVSTSTSFSADPYVYTPDKMLLNVTSNPVTELKADASGKVTVRGTTLPNATITATSDNPSKVVCGSATVDGEGNFSLAVTMDSSFYGVSKITLNAEKEDAETGSVECMVFRTYKDNKTFSQGFKKNYKELGSGLSLSALLSNQSTYATSDYGYRVRAKVVEVIQGEDGYSYVRMTLLGSGETVYVMNLSEKWDPGKNINGNYRLYGFFLGTYQDSGNALFAATLAYSQK